MRDDFELVATYGNFTKLLPGAADDTEGNDSDDETPHLELSATMRVRLKKILEVLGEM